MDATSAALGALVVALTTLVFYNKIKTKHSITVEVDGEKVQRAVNHPKELITEPENIPTLYDSFLHATKKYGDRPASGTRKSGKEKDTWGEYEWKSYNEIKKKAENFASGIINIGAKSGDRIGIFSKNREEWLVAQQACFTQSLVIVSFYETLGKDSIRYVASHSEITIAICNGDSLAKLFEVVDGKEGYKNLNHIIVMDKYDEKTAKKAEELGIHLYAFSDVEKEGGENPAKHNPPKSKDLATIMYTSGTTGTPKGVLLTHGNLMSEINGIMHAYNVPSDACYLSFLPLAHIFERIIVLACIHAGGRIGFFHGDIQAIPDDVKVLKPTIFVGVPRIYDRTKDAIMKQVEKASIFARLAFNFAFNLKKFSILYAPWIPLGFLDTLVFNKTKAALGGKIQLMVSAGAPLSYKSELFLRICFGIPVSQAYGLTETCGASTFKLPDDGSIGHIGSPLACNEFKLADLKDMGYTTQDKPNPRGELCLRGKNIAVGYYRDEEKTKESFVEGGWFLTGDIAELTSDGTLRIVDRKKNMFKLAQGEYVAAEQVEDKLLKQCDEIEQLCIYGDSEQTTLVAIIVPKKGANGGQDGGGKAERDRYKKLLEDAGRKSGLQGFEIPRSAWIASEAFTQENDLLTPTMKLKRNSIRDKYKDAIKKMYSESSGSRK